MNSKGHLTISIIKFATRIVSCLLAVIFGNTNIALTGIVLAEVLGILEEIVDKR